MSRSDALDLMLDTSLHTDDAEETKSPSSELSRTKVIKAARQQSPRTNDIAQITSLTLERRSFRTILRSALSGLVSLVHLNLSRNELTSLRGLESATSLESLSLYYNRIAYLDELQRLTSLTRLESLDLRLNPVTRDEAYRSYAIFHLPSLNELDERSVRPAERRHATHTVADMDEGGGAQEQETDREKDQEEDHANEQQKERVYDQKRGDTNRRFDQGRGHDRAADAGLKLSSEEIIQNYQQSVAKVKDLKGRQKRYSGGAAREQYQQQPYQQQQPDPIHPSHQSYRTQPMYSADPPRPARYAQPPQPPQPLQPLQPPPPSIRPAPQQHPPPFTSLRPPTYSTSTSTPPTPLPQHSSLPSSLLPQADTVLEEISTAIASVQLPQQLTISSVTLIHMPDLVARAARPALAQVVSKLLSHVASGVTQHTEKLVQTEASLRQLKTETAVAVDLTSTIVTMQKEMDRMSQRLTVKDTKMASMEQEYAELHRIRSTVAQKEIENGCLEAVNMLRESHRALMENDARMREELCELKKRYRHDARKWRNNFRDLQQYYLGLKDSPPLVAEHELNGGVGSVGSVGGVGVSGSVGGSPHRHNSGSVVQDAADELTNKINALERRELGSAQNDPMRQSWRNTRATTTTPRTAAILKDVDAARRSTSSNDLLSPAVSDVRKEALGSLSPLKRERWVAEGGSNEGSNGGSERSTPRIVQRTQRSSSTSPTRRKWAAPPSIDTSTTPAKDRNAQQDKLDDDMRESLNMHTLLVSASRKIVGPKE